MRPDMCRVKRRRVQGHQVQGYRDDTGAAAVEFAIISVLLFTILFGILQYGFFFFQLATAQSVVAAAARRVEVGDITDCAAWHTEFEDQMALSSATDITWGRTTGTDPIARGDNVTVSLEWTPVRIGAGLVPFPGSGTQVRTQAVDVDHPGEDAAIWGANPGCS